MCRAMKIKKLKNYGIPSYIVNAWEKHYSPCLLPLQEDAVRNYGVLDYGEESDDKREDARNGRNEIFWYRYIKKVCNLGKSQSLLRLYN